MMKYLLLALSLLMVGCASKVVENKPFSGTFPTIDVRQMWQSCMSGHSIARRFPPQVAMVVCDCVTDSTRKDHVRDILASVYTDNDTKGQEAQVEYWAKTNAVCQVKIMNKIGEQQGFKLSPKGKFIPPQDTQQMIMPIQKDML